MERGNRERSFSPMPSEQNQGQRGKFSVVIVDDDPQDRRMLRRALADSDLPVVVLEAADRAAAMPLLREGRVDCAILDCSLPDGSGLSTIQGIRDAGIDIPLIVVTDHGEEQITELLKAGASDSLPKKDLTPAAIVRSVRSALRFYHQERAADQAVRLRDQAIAAAASGVIICDLGQPDTPIIYCNPAFTTITGYSAEETLGRNCRFLQGSDTDPLAVEEIRAALREGRNIQVVLKNYRKDGTAFWNEISISPVRDRLGTVTHYVGIQNDITQRREMEEDRARLLIERQEVAQRERALLREILASVTEGKLRLCDEAADLPASYPVVGEPILLPRHEGSRALRRATQATAIEAGLPELRWNDLVTATSEAAMNAVVHGGGGQGWVCTDPTRGIQVWIQDWGGGISLEHLPRMTLEKGASGAGSLGFGFFIILQTVDRLWLNTGPTGTTVVLEVQPQPTEPAWLQRAIGPGG